MIPKLLARAAGRMEVPFAKMQTTEGKMLLGGRLCREGGFLFGPVTLEARRARSGWESLAWRELRVRRGEARRAKP